MDNNYIRNISTLVIIGFLVVLSFFLLKSILLSIITGLVLGSLFVPLYVRMNKKIKSRNLCAIIIILLMLLLIIIPLFFLTPTLLEQSVKIYDGIYKTDFVGPLKAIFPKVFNSDKLSTEIGATLLSFAARISNKISTVISGFILNFPIFFLRLLIVFFTFFFVVRDHEKLLSYIKSILPFSKTVEDKIFSSTKDITLSLLYGQIVLGIIQGLIVGGAFILFGVNNALFLMLLACIAGIFPIIGTAIIWVPVFIFLIVNGSYVSALGVLGFGVISAIIENVLKPALISKRTKVHSAVILIGMVGGLSLFGAIGFIIGPLVLSYLLIVLEIFRDKRTPGFFIKQGATE